jgi:hypothetical protein
LEDEFEDRLTLRARIREAINANALDGAHDMDGNALYHIQFTASVPPGKNKSQFGLARLRIEPPQFTQDDIDLLYFTWLAYLINRSILYLRRAYHSGQVRISWYLARYHGIKISSGGVYNVLKRYGLNRLPDRQHKRSIATIRYEKQVPGHHVQVDVKFLDFKTEAGRKVRYFQYTAIDDATRIRALKIYERHTQQNAIDFVDYVIAKFPFRINTVRTDNDH